MALPAHLQRDWRRARPQVRQEIPQLCCKPLASEAGPRDWTNRNQLHAAADTHNRLSVRLHYYDNVSCPEGYIS